MGYMGHAHKGHAHMKLAGSAWYSSDLNANNRGELPKYRKKARMNYKQMSLPMMKHAWKRMGAYGAGNMAQAMNW